MDREVEDSADETWLDVDVRAAEFFGRKVR
jgi:hypothetical protein